MPIDTSMYNTPPPQPFNPLQAIGQYAGAANAIKQNQLIQQNIEQAAMQNQLTRSNIAAKQLASQHVDSNGNIDYNALISDAAKDPDASLAIPTLMQERAKNNALTQSGIDPQGRPVYQAQQSVAAAANPTQAQIDDQHKHMDNISSSLYALIQKPDLSTGDVLSAAGDMCAAGSLSPKACAAEISTMPSDPAQIRPWLQNHLDNITSNQAALTQKFGPPSSAKPVLAPTFPMGMPVGYERNQGPVQAHYQDVMNAADSANTEKAALNNILDISKSGAPTGTVLGKFYSYLAEHNMAPAGAQTDAEKLQLIRSHASQIAQATGSRSDSDLASKISAISTADDLPNVIQTMVPYLKGVQSAKIAQAAYYNKQDPTGTDPRKIQQARLNWQSNADPRLFEMQELKSNPQEFQKYINGLDPQDASQLMAKYQAAKASGILQ